MASPKNLPVTKIPLPGACRPIRKGFGAGPLNARAIPGASLNGLTKGELGYRYPVCQLNPPFEGLENGLAGSGM